MFNSGMADRLKPRHVLYIALSTFPGRGSRIAAFLLDSVRYCRGSRRRSWYEVEGRFSVKAVPCILGACNSRHSICPLHSKSYIKVLCTCTSAALQFKVTETIGVSSTQQTSHCLTIGQLIWCNQVGPPQSGRKIMRFALIFKYGKVFACRFGFIHPWSGEHKCRQQLDNGSLLFISVSNMRYPCLGSCNNNRIRPQERYL